MPKNKYCCDCNIIHEDLVNKANKNLLSPLTIGEISNFFYILGDPTRCKIISILLKQDMCVCDLSNILSMSKSSVSHQLSKMKEYKVVKSNKVGKEVIYSLDDDHVKNIFLTTLEHIEHERK